jgi:hypothetical protein
MIYELRRGLFARFNRMGRMVRQGKAGRRRSAFIEHRRNLALEVAPHMRATHDRARSHPPSLSRLEASRAVLGLAAAARGVTPVAALGNPWHRQ